MATCGSLIYIYYTLLMRFALISKIATLTDCPITKLQTHPTYAQFPHSQHFPLNNRQICPQICFRPALADEKMTEEGRVFEVRDVNDLPLIYLSSQGHHQSKLGQNF